MSELMDDINKALEAGYIGPPPPPGFKPTHIITYGMKADGYWYEYSTNLATGETISTNISLIEFKPSDIDLWRSVPKGYKLINHNVEVKKTNLVNRLHKRY